MVEFEGKFRSFGEFLDTDEVDDIVRENLVVIGRVLEVERKKTLRANENQYRAQKHVDER